MREHPILFSAPMIKSILTGRKSVTRRLSPQWMKVKAGDRLWVRETWQPIRSLTVDEQIQQTVTLDAFAAGQIPANQIVSAAMSLPAGSGEQRALYAADFGDWAYAVDSDLRPWKPSIHMPRKFSRILLECEEDTRPERLHDITEEEISLEGFSQELFRELLLPSLGRCPAVPLHWIHGSDEGLGWCNACARLEIRRLRKLEPGKEFILDGGWAAEEDTQPFCEGCERELECLYTDHAIGYELDHFEENGMSGVVDEHSMYNILSAPANDSEAGRISRVGFRWLWDSLHPKVGERWADNPIVYRVGRFNRVPLRP